MKQWGLFTVIILLIGFYSNPPSVYGQCTPTVECISVGPPTWTYSYNGSGSGTMSGFFIYNACGVTNATGPGGFTPMILDTATVYYPADSPAACSVYVNFTLTSPVAIDGAINWQDLGAPLASGMVCGPVLCGAPTLTPSPTSLPTETFTVGPTATITPTSAVSSTPSVSPTTGTSPTPVITPTFTTSMIFTPTVTSSLIPEPTHSPTPIPTGTMPTFTPYPSPGPGAVFKLCPGLNLISVPYFNPDLDTAAELIAVICPGNVDAVWKHDCTTDLFTSWTFLDPGSGWPAEAGIPFWVNITNASGCTWVPIGVMDYSMFYDLCLGLNLVSRPVFSTSLVNASDLMADITGCEGVWRWKREQSCSNPQGFDAYFIISPPVDDFPLKAAYSYWVTVTIATTWYPPVP